MNEYHHNIIQIYMEEKMYQELLNGLDQCTAILKFHSMKTN